VPASHPGLLEPPRSRRLDRHVSCLCCAPPRRRHPMKRCCNRASGPSRVQPQNRRVSKLACTSEGVVWCCRSGGSRAYRLPSAANAWSPYEGGHLRATNSGLTTTARTVPPPPDTTHTPRSTLGTRPHATPAHHRPSDHAVHDTHVHAHATTHDGHPNSKPRRVGLSIPLCDNPRHPDLPMVPCSNSPFERQKNADFQRKPTETEISKPGGQTESWQARPKLSVSPLKHAILQCFCEPSE